MYIIVWEVNTGTRVTGVNVYCKVITESYHKSSRATWILFTFAPTRKVASSWLPLTNWQQTAALTFPEDTWVLIISTPSIIGRGNPISPYSERTQWIQFRSCLVQPMLTISSSSNFIYTGWHIQLRGWYPEEPVIWLFANLPKAWGELIVLRVLFKVTYIPEELTV